ncbi:MAG TPA: hypothetical protein VH109_00185 [Steroidobacteraceae bacterium]|jgi:hypothetical protein|nr:hypothetical protein [Steroidobacteraceae bacterium]
MRTITLAAALVGFALASACGHKADQAAAQRTAVKKARATDDGLARMVSAVTSVKPGSAPLPLELKFDLRERPEVAKPVDVYLAIVPLSAAIDRVFGKVAGEDGLELVSGGELQEAAKPTEGVPIQYSVKVLPKQDGIYTLTANLSVDSAGQISSQTYTIPVIAGQGIPDLPAMPPGKTAATASSQPAKPGSATR